MEKVRRNTFPEIVELKIKSSIALLYSEICTFIVLCTSLLNIKPETHTDKTIGALPHLRHLYAPTKTKNSEGEVSKYLH